MALTDAEFAALLADPTKTIDGDIKWSDDEDHCAVEFRVGVSSALDYPLAIKGSYNSVAGALSFTLFDPRGARLYALDLGRDHRNPDRTLVGETHKHRWTERYRDKQAYRPTDITATPRQVVLAWEQFCKEANITHRGKMAPPKMITGNLVL